MWCHPELLSLTYEALAYCLPLLPSHPVAEKEEADHNSYRATERQRLEDELRRQGPQRIGGSEDVKALWWGGGGGVVMLEPRTFMHVRHANFSPFVSSLGGPSLSSEELAERRRQQELDAKTSEKLESIRRKVGRGLE